MPQLDRQRHDEGPALDSGQVDVESVEALARASARAVNSLTRLTIDLKGPEYLAAAAEIDGILDGISAHPQALNLFLAATRTRGKRPITHRDAERRAR